MELRHGPDNSRPRVLVADDDVQTRLGARLALEHEGFEVCAEAGDAASAIDLALRLRPDVCLVDVDLPGDGLATARAISARAGEVRVVMLAVSCTGATLVRALDAGACGYVLKRTPPAAVAAVLHAVLTDAVVIPPGVARRLIGERTTRFARRDPRALTSREWDVAQLLRDGLSTAEIAQRLFISETTVRRHVSAILRKLDVPDRAAAIRVVDTG